VFYLRAFRSSSTVLLLLFLSFIAPERVIEFSAENGAPWVAMNDRNRRSSTVDEDRNARK